MIDINKIIHTKDKIFDIDSDIAVLCVKDFSVGNFEFKKESIYSIEFAKSVGTIINNFTLTCTTQKDIFQIIEKEKIITLQDTHKTKQKVEQSNVTDIMYKTIEKLIDKKGNTIRKGTQLSSAELKEKGLDPNENNEKLMEIKIIKE